MGGFHGSVDIASAAATQDFIGHEVKQFILSGIRMPMGKISAKGAKPFVEGIFFFLLKAIFTGGGRDLLLGFARG